MGLALPHKKCETPFKNFARLVAEKKTGYKKYHGKFLGLSHIYGQNVQFNFVHSVKEIDCRNWEIPLNSRRQRSQETGSNSNAVLWCIDTPWCDRWPCGQLTSEEKGMRSHTSWALAVWLSFLGCMPISSKYAYESSQSRFNQQSW